MNDAAKRALRTFVQAFIGTLTVTLIPFLSDIVRSATSMEPYEFDYTVLQNIGVAAILSGVIALVSFAHNELEQKTGTDVLPK